MQAEDLIAQSFPTARLQRETSPAIARFPIIR
jgi:hypothetical protein